MKSELLIFGLVAFATMAVLTAIVLAAGVPFGMSAQHAIPIAFYILVVILPGGMNLWIAATGSGGEDTTERVAAGVRGVAMIVGLTSFIFLFGPRNWSSQYLPYLLSVSLLLFAWSIWRESRHQHKKLKDLGLIRYK